jgi:uncharacterized protein YjiS (DUF1127 family)
VRTISSPRPAPQAMVWRSRLTELVALWKRWRSAYKTWRLERAAITQLSSLSERQLKDIGLNRSEIIDAVRGRVAREHVSSR